MCYGTICEKSNYCSDRRNSGKFLYINPLNPSGNYVYNVQVYSVTSRPLSTLGKTVQETGWAPVRSARNLIIAAIGRIQESFFVLIL